MRVFHCDHCGSLLFFENVRCESCGHKLAYLPDLNLVASLEPVNPQPVDGPPGQLWMSPVPRSQARHYRLCTNYHTHNICNWAVPVDDPNPLCTSCRLTRIIPDLNVPENIKRWQRLEAAKRRLVFSLLEYQLPLKSKAEEPQHGLTFRFMGDLPGGPAVLTGHDNGVITVNIAEADDVERERRRGVELHEPYRTLLGHFRHEVGHYYWDVLIKNSPRIDAYRQLFGDERTDYGKALKEHYEHGPRRDWQKQFVSEYAAVHPWEDWAETWAHYLHMTDTLETAAACGLSLQPSRPDEPVMEKQPNKPARQHAFNEIIKNWFPLTYALNSLNRGMGMGDAYPFTLPTPAVEKLRFVHETICGCEAVG